MKTNINIIVPCRSFRPSTLPPIERLQLLPNYWLLSKLAPLILGVLLALTAFQSQAQNLVLEWKLSDTNGSPTVADSSGNGYAGKVNANSNTTFNVTGGLIGGCVQFSGVGDQRIYMDTNGIFPAALNTDPNQYPITISVWSKNNVASGGNQLLSFGVNNGSVYHACRQQGYLDERANGSDHLIGTGAAQTTGWNNIVCIYSATNSQAIYVNGTLNASGTVFGVTNKVVQFAIGGLYRVVGSAPANPYAGSMEDVAVWTNVLTAQQIAAIYGLGHFSSGYASDMPQFLNAFTAGTNVAIRGILWMPTNGLSGSLGSVGGTVAGDTAYVVLDGSGDGMQVIGAAVPPIVSSFAITPSLIFAGDIPTLSWNVGGASSVTINQGIGPVVSTGSSNITTSTSAVGSSVTWTLVATNIYGATTNFATLTIQPTPGPLTLVAHWPVDEASGTTATNSLGDYCTGQFVVLSNTINGVTSPAIAPAWEPTNGYIGGDLFFTTALTTNMAVVRSVLSDVTLTNYPFTNYPFAMAAWVNTADTLTRNETVLSLCDSNSPSAYYCLQVDTGQARLGARNGAEIDLYSGVYVYGDGDPANRAEWHYIVCDFERDSVRNIYVDGALAGTDTNALGGFFQPNRFSGGAIDRAANPGISAPYTGRADELALFAGTLTPSEVSLFYGGMSGLQLNTYEINTLWNAFLATNSATVHGSVWLYTTGLSGNIGATGGALTNFNAYIVMDANGDGMQMATNNGPTISSLSPSSPETGSSGSQTLTIIGGNFQSGCTAILSNVDTSTSVSPVVTFVDSSNLTINATFTVIPHNWSVQVINPGNAASVPYGFTVVAPPQPKIKSIGLVSGNVVLTGTNGTAGLTYTVLTSTNVALPLASWTPVTTNTFGAGGSVDWTNAVNPAKPQSFYIIKP